MTQGIDARRVLPVDPVIDAYKKDVDRTLLRENLKLSVEQRWRKLIDTLRFLREWQGAGRPGPR
jgi:hypothetical protein